MYKILAINPGSTSTKIAIYHDDKEQFVKNIHHSNEELAKFKRISNQFSFRKEIILKELAHAGVDVKSFKAIVGRGGLIKPISSGVYEVNDAMVKDLTRVGVKEHASNLGALIAMDIANNIDNAKAYIADPVVVDELQEIARISGHVYFERISIFHALNHKAVGRAYAKKINKKYEDLNLIIAHMGGGVTVGAHKRGRVIDVNNGLDGDGPFSPERSGGLPTGSLVQLCYSGELTIEQMQKQLVGEGGFVSYLGTNSGLEVENRALDGDSEAMLIFEAMGYQTAKEIGAMSAVLKGDVDAIIITGGLAYSKHLTKFIEEHVSHISKVHVEPGEDEMSALALNGLAALKNEVETKVYS
ncbi:butyrate kinase [Balneicella halophila]|uniref:Probable butyrate kinase n=1 Tax=Balneicella halophila TaxID=1537566 RepID=A0A7L4UST1_BALHA|nr:butyrate kinase [Balneicella halophila]PVX52074.1 butyrate kinase [Balneicella halophila]